MEISAANREHADDASEENSDIVLTALELTDDLSEILKGILEKLNKLDTIERTVKMMEGSLFKLEEIYNDEARSFGENGQRKH